MKAGRCVFAEALIVLASCAVASAGTITYWQGEILPSGTYEQVGATIRQVLADGNDGANSGYRVGFNFQANPAVLGDFRAVLGFNLSDIPSGSTITSISLQMTTDDLNDNYPRLVELHQITTLAMIVEGTRVISDTPPPPDGVTWNQIGPGDPWGTPGGDFSSTLLSSASGYSASLQTVTFGSSSAFVSAAQSALDQSRPLQMILTPGAISGRGDTDFKSDDNVTAAFRPELTVDFTAPAQAPEPSTLLLVSIGAALFGLRQATSRARRRR